jgi:hypothetical protein
MTLRVALRVAWPTTRPIPRLCLNLRLGSTTTLSRNGGKK